MKRIFERETGRRLELADLIGDRYVNHVRNGQLFRYEENTPEEIDAAVGEALSAIRLGPQDSERQAHVRRLITEATLRHRKRNSYVRKWGTDNGFLGHGRFVDFQLAEIHP